LRALFSSLRRHAPFLFSERGALSLTRSMGVGKGGGTLTPGADNRGVSAEGAALQGLDLTGRTLAGCGLSKATITGLQFADGRCLRTHWRRATVQDLEASGSSWDVVDFEAAKIERVTAGGSRWCLVSFRDATLTDVDLKEATLVVCDFTRAALTNVDLAGARLTGVDFQGAGLRNVSFRGADLGGCLFNGAWFSGVDFADASVQGADFRDAGGLDQQTRADLRARGARVGGGRVRRLWARLLGGDDPVAAQPRIRLAMGTTWALLLILVPGIFFARAILHPVNPDAPPGFEEPAEPDAETPDKASGG
jgi:uncharacterized protein YjbI with pentapeptide repeats